MKLLVWHVHGGWMDSFLRGGHDYLIPAGASPLPAGLPLGVREVAPDALRDEEIDVVVLQRLEDFDEAERLLGRRPGRDVPAVFVEHNTPKQLPVTERHPYSDQRDIPIVHVTHFNRLVWDCGDAVTHVIEHGVPDPGAHYSGDLESLGVVINEPVRRARVTGTDLLPGFAAAAPIDCFGIDTDLLPAALDLDASRLRIIGDIPTRRLHAELARRRAYVHPFRWTSLGLSLLEAMHLAMPVLVLATTEAPRAVPPEAGAISSDPAELVRAARRFIEDPDEARTRGAAAREFAQAHYGLPRFLDDWDALLTALVEARARTRRSAARSTRRSPELAAAASAGLSEGVQR